MSNITGIASRLCLKFSHLLCMAAVFLAAGSAYGGLDGTLYIVNSLEDTVAADGALTFREAIDAASRNTQVNEAPAGSATETDVIIFEPGLVADGADIYLTNNLNISGDTYIEGSLYNPVTLHATSRWPTFIIQNSSDRMDIVGLKFTASGPDKPCAIHNSAKLNIDGCVFTNNNGAIINMGGELDIYCSDFYNNTNENSLPSGGAIFSHDGELTVENCSFEDNVAAKNIGIGGSIYISKQKARIFDSEFIGNYAGGYDPVFGGGAIACNYGELEITGCTFSENQARYGSAIHLGTDSVLTVSHSVFSKNNATEQSLIYNDMVLPGTTKINISNSLITGNYSEGYPSIINGSDMISYSAVITNCTIAGNSSPRSGLFNIIVEINNSIISENYYTAGHPLQKIYELMNVEFHEWQTYYNCIINTDAGFVRTPSAGPDGIWFTGDDDLGDLHLRPDSFAVNTGDNELAPDCTGIVPLDIDGNSRIRWNIIDIGAYELQDEISPNREAPSALVTTPFDHIDYFDNEISLREAVLYARQLNQPVSFDMNQGHQVLLTKGPLYINNDLVINGEGIELVPCGITVTKPVQLELNGLSIYGTTRFNGSRLLVNGCNFTNSDSAIRIAGQGEIMGELHPIELIIKDSLFSGISSRPAVYCFGDDIDVSIINSVIARNDTTGVYIISEQPDSNTLKIVNSTIAFNNHESDNANIIGGIYHNNTAVSVHNSIIAMNSSAGLIKDIDTDGVEILSSIIADDPLFVANPGPGDDGEWGTTDDFYGDLSLSASSPAIDAGDNSLALDENGQQLTTDFTGSRRIDRGTVDIGAYEFDSGPNADINYDGHVNIFDFLILRSNYPTASGATYEMGDIDRDGDVDILDFLILRSQYFDKI